MIFMLFFAPAVFRGPESPDHLRHESGHNRGTEQDDQGGRNKRHYEKSGIREVKRCNQNVDPEKDEKATAQGQGDPAYPPEHHLTSSRLS